MLEEELKEVVAQKKEQNLPRAVIRNFLKEYLQYLVLEIIYTSRDYKKLVFTGGSCLRICFGLPRLSEDLDFNFLAADFPRPFLTTMGGFLKKRLGEKLEKPILISKIQEDNRLYLKFSVLKELGLAPFGESDWLYVKIEISKEEATKIKTELSAISDFGVSFLARRFSLPLLMAGKIAAILSRVWFKGKQSEIDIKGRDFYDLFWFCQKGILPDAKRLKALTGISSEPLLRKVLLARIDRAVTAQKLYYDLSAVLENQEFARDFCQNYKEIVKPYLDKLKIFRG